MKYLPFMMLACAGGLAAQDADPLEAGGKLWVHTVRTFGPGELLGSALGSGLGQVENDPREWGQGVAGYARRYANIEGFALTQNALAFGLDTVMHDDPRYFRSTRSGFFSRLAHALSYTLATRTDDGETRINTWRLASNYGAAWMNNIWLPRRITTPGDVLVRGSIGLVIDTGSNLGHEFGRDLKGFFKKTLLGK